MSAGRGRVDSGRSNDQVLNMGAPLNAGAEADGEGSGEGEQPPGSGVWPKVPGELDLPGLVKVLLWKRRAQPEPPPEGIERDRFFWGDGRTWDRRGAHWTLSEPDKESRGYSHPASLARPAARVTSEHWAAVVRPLRVQWQDIRRWPRSRVESRWHEVYASPAWRARALPVLRTKSIVGESVQEHAKRAQKLPNRAPHEERKQAAAKLRAKHQAARADVRSESEALATFTTPITVECLAQQDHDCGTEWKVLPSDLDELGRAECPKCGELTVLLPAEPEEHANDSGITRVINAAPTWRKDRTRQGGKKWKTQIKITDLAARSFDDDGPAHARAPWSDSTDWTEYEVGNGTLGDIGCSPARPARRKARKGGFEGSVSFPGDSGFRRTLIHLPQLPPYGCPWSDAYAHEIADAKARQLEAEGGVGESIAEAFWGQAAVLTGFDADTTIKRAQWRVSERQCPTTVPDWARNPALVGWLIDVCSFDAAGDGQIREDTLRALLASPRKLAETIRKRTAAESEKLTYKAAVQMIAAGRALADTIDLGRPEKRGKGIYHVVDEEENALDARQMKGRREDQSEHPAWWTSRAEHHSLKGRVTKGGGRLPQCECRRDRCRCGALDAERDVWDDEACSCGHWLDAEGDCFWCRKPAAVLPGVEIDAARERFELRAVYADAGRKIAAESISASNPPKAAATDVWWWRAKAEPSELKCKGGGTKKLYRWVQIRLRDRLDHDAVCPGCWDDVAAGSDVVLLRARRLPYHPGCLGMPWAKRQDVTPRRERTRFPWQITDDYAELLRFLEACAGRARWPRAHRWAEGAARSIVAPNRVMHSGLEPGARTPPAVFRRWRWDCARPVEAECNCRACRFKRSNTSGFHTLYLEPCRTDPRTWSSLSRAPRSIDPLRTPSQHDRDVCVPIREGGPPLTGLGLWFHDVVAARVCGPAMVGMPDSGRWRASPAGVDYSEPLWSRALFARANLVILHGYGSDIECLCEDPASGGVPLETGEQVEPSRFFGAENAETRILPAGRTAGRT
jgi:hypothetical protein